ncbi:MAG: potassium transporter Kup [Betaproteobacteria bacterium]|nr:potassium transporter Kup [Betaproteobacteria bacterium]
MPHPITGDSKRRGSASVPALSLLALGVVFGDIGTSPLYAFKEAFSGPHGLPLSEAYVLAVLSLIFWSIAFIVSLKYVAIVLRFDNGGEGGILALLALATRIAREQPPLAKTVVILGIFGASLFYGDAVITPAISVLSAIEGLSVSTPAFEHWIVPLTIAVLIGLFSIQKRGTGAVGKLFGPVMVIWFLAIGALGVISIVQTPAILAALDPRHALNFIVHSPGLTFLVLGAVFLAVTGAEAVYADMGHFGPNPIRIAWFGLAFPGLILSYFGQGALVLRDPAALKNPFYLLAPEDLQLPLVLLATAATVIASQATISGAFSLTQQASRLGYLPRIPTRHTSEYTRGQIYIPQVNWALLIFVILLVLGFKTSSAIASAYGVAVSGMMVLTTALIAVIVLRLSRRIRPFLLSVLAVVGLMEVVFFAANLSKIADGGWVSLLCAGVIFVMLTTWKRAESVLAAHEARSRIAVKNFPAMCGASIPRVSGTAVYMSPDLGWIPTVLLHNLKHNKVLHERVVFLTIVDEDVPRIADRDRTEIQVIERGRMYQAALHYGFMEDPDVSRGMKLLERHGLKFIPEETTYFLGKSTIARATKPGLFTWRRELFRWMQRNSPATSEYFNLAPNRVIELGTRLSI